MGITGITDETKKWRQQVAALCTETAETVGGNIPAALMGADLTAMRKAATLIEQIQRTEQGFTSDDVVAMDNARLMRVAAECRAVTQ